MRIHNIRIKIAFAVILMLALLAVGGISPAIMLHVSAAESYSNVLDDLKKDSAFQSSAYPVNNKDYSLQVIQIAESTDGDLFVYVYEPCAERELTAKYLRFSTEIGENFSPKDYELTELSRAGVFVKYLVTDFTVKSDTVRYYDITAIHRPFDLEFDDPNTGATINGNYAETVAFSVGKLYTATTANGSVSYECFTSETIEVTAKYVGHLNYPNGFSLLNSSCDSWYVAFSTDRQIDRLLEADISFISRTYERKKYQSPVAFVTYGEKKKTNKTLTSTDRAGNRPTWLFGNSHKWNRIQSVSEFAEEVTSETTKDKLKSFSWVLRFLETDFKRYIPPSLGGILGTDFTEWGTEVSEVTILRLRFETAGKVYNLGVVDNHTTPDPDAPPDNPKPDFWEWFLAKLKGLLKKSPVWFWVLVVVVFLMIVAPILVLSAWFFVWLIKKIFGKNDSDN